MEPCAVSLYLGLYIHTRMLSLSVRVLFVDSVGGGAWGSSRLKC